MLSRKAPLLLTALAMAAFAANSILCRLALRAGAIDPVSFSAIRVGSGALVLVALALGQPGRYSFKVNWWSSLALGLYIAPFSFAYVDLSTGIGALILFGSVQLTMLVAALRAGERLRLPQWVGLLGASGGLLVLLLPGQAAPSLRGAGLMALAGIAWGSYSLRGRGSQRPLNDTANNFLLCTPLLVAVCAFFTEDLHTDLRGALLAATSGAFASGLGYAVWYAALRSLAASHAAIVQLSVPIIAAGYGVLFMAEPLTGRLKAASALVLGGVWLALRKK